MIRFDTEAKKAMAYYSKKAVVTGAGGFIGHHLVRFLKGQGYWVRGVDIKSPEFSEIEADEFLLLDLRIWENCLEATQEVDEVYALAADMGGMGFISSNHAKILRNNSLIDVQTLEAARKNRVGRYPTNPPGRRAGANVCLDRGLSGRKAE